MEESILVSVKKMCGIAKDYNAFDLDIITHINTVFMILYQMGVGPVKPFRIEDDGATWSDFISEENYECVKSYVGLKVRLLFDPPSSSIHMESMKGAISELEWRLYTESELAKTN